MNRIISLWIASIILLLTLSACAVSPRIHEDQDAVIIALASSSEPASGFDPILGWGAGEHVHEPLIQSTLTYTTNDLKIANDLAVDVSASDDGMQWVVHIRDDVRFTDGSWLTAEDVAFTYNTAKTHHTIHDLTMLENAQAIDATTIVFYMNKPFSIWPYTMAAIGIVPAHAYTSGYGQHPIGSGRYMLTQWDKGQQVILEANPDYYGTPALMKRVTILFMDETAAFAAVKAGAVDLTYTTASFSSQGVDGYLLLSFESVDNRGLNLPCTTWDGVIGNDVTSDIALRQALNIGINRQEMIERVLNGYGRPAYSACDQMPWFNSQAIVPYDPERARSILDQAGWLMGSDGIRQKGKTRAAITLLYPAGDSVRQALAAEVSNQFKQLGLDIKTQQVSWDEAYSRAQSDVMTWGWGAHTPMELYHLHSSKTENGLALYSPYANPKVDAYMEQALSCSNLDTSYTLWQKAQWDGEGGIIADIPWIWLVNIDHLYWADEKLIIAPQKIHPHGHGWSIVNNVDQWRWE